MLNLIHARLDRLSFAPTLPSPRSSVPSVLQLEGLSLRGRHLNIGLDKGQIALVEGGSRAEGAGPRIYASCWVIVTQIVVLDAVFSLDSVITAVGMVKPWWVLWFLDVSNRRSVLSYYGIIALLLGVAVMLTGAVIANFDLLVLSPKM